VVHIGTAYLWSLRYSRLQVTARLIWQPKDTTFYILGNSLIIYFYIIFDDQTQVDFDEQGLFLYQSRSEELQSRNLDINRI